MLISSSFKDPHDGQKLVLDLYRSHSLFHMSLAVGFGQMRPEMEGERMLGLIDRTKRARYMFLIGNTCETTIKG